jgi:hypothetical protein
MLSEVFTASRGALVEECRRDGSGAVLSLSPTIGDDKAEDGV